eukprot:1150781-Pelagomonas_calceolata.AAC.9
MERVIGGHLTSIKASSVVSAYHIGEHIRNHSGTCYTVALQHHKCKASGDVSLEQAIQWIEEQLIRPLNHY